MIKKAIISSFLLVLTFISLGQKNDILPVPSDKPTKGQLAQIKRKYGMFIHFGINTFHNEEWTDGSKSPSTYFPKTIDAEQWVKTAMDAGMKYVILVSKHHDGFCLWDSKYTEYDVASSQNKTNVVEALAKACKKYDIGLGLYYSLWDRHQNGNTKDSLLDKAYNEYIINQLTELIELTSQYIPVIEFWFDGGWEKQNTRWPVQEIYNSIKSREPLCQIGINWSIGKPGNDDEQMVLPEQQQNGYPIRYFPSDFRLGDPYLPANPDPKIYTHKGINYYMPFETTVCLSGKWFYHTKDKKYKTLDELVAIYYMATEQDNVLILNCPPNREGKMREKDADLLKELRKKLNL
jgi:alpha-L-fucosidase